jgi:hypothetical protein
MSSVGMGVAKVVMDGAQQLMGVSKWEQHGSAVMDVGK